MPFVHGVSRERRHVEPDFVNARDQQARVVRDSRSLCTAPFELANLGLAAERVSEFGLDHGERGLDVRSLVVAAEKRVPLVGEQVEHPGPGGRLGRWHMGCDSFGQSGEVTPEGDERRTASILDGPEVGPAGVSLVSHHVAKLEVRRGLRKQRHELAVVGGTRSIVARHLDPR